MNRYVIGSDTDICDGFESSHSRRTKTKTLLPVGDGRRKYFHQSSFGQRTPAQTRSSLTPRMTSLLSIVWATIPPQQKWDRPQRSMSTPCLNSFAMLPMVILQPDRFGGLYAHCSVFHTRQSSTFLGTMMRQRRPGMSESQVIGRRSRGRINVRWPKSDNYTMHPSPRAAGS